MEKDEAEGGIERRDHRGGLRRIARLGLSRLEFLL